jgi:hypothetical protein
MLEELNEDMPKKLKQSEPQDCKEAIDSETSKILDIMRSKQARTEKLLNERIERLNKKR